VDSHWVTIPLVEPAEELCGTGLLAPRNQAIKRVFEVAIAALLLILALPAACVIAVAIILETRGPVFFGHTRIGKDERRFRVWKFRSMVAEADVALRRYLKDHPERRAEWRRSHKLKQDPRVTRVGRLLRRSSLDELPQLWNVLRGDMSLIGPRPIVEEEISKYGPSLSLYLQVQPGLTGLWQVSGRADTGYRRRVDLDCQYIRNWSLLVDLKILLKTVRVVLCGHGAY
jgi:Undecaprenyl-phosphate galactose phosphotransferase WbaP